MIVSYNTVSINNVQCVLVLDNSEDDEGIPRVSQALQAHMWPNMTMKGQGSLLQSL